MGVAVGGFCLLCVNWLFGVLFVFIMGGVFLQRYGVEVVEINPNVARLICGK